ncbi:hypothetical protein SYNPS1DRAFT_25813 [Syncephalis pseudoplumigaleata]|uniref:DUF1746 domain-containing protein n=1 Tax=Syncephalis pseudoplumigaleata TaxID=1712513 RepID=A0A4P9YSS8_9FUNG|nr:hypothetical protein SYNPS1DRAFT_25813 [Syncephalis pseudoplumigaleata]|eukprot:RKP22442.1 hypothetical protein SYNPS1DRAFT_25813 [Syncephalis pseudoplumigaleata]
MNTAAIAKHNLNQALTWLVYIHLVAVYYLDYSFVFLALRGYMQWNLSVQSMSIALRLSFGIIVAMTLLCALRRLQSPDGPGIIIDFIGTGRGIGRDGEKP